MAPLKTALTVEHAVLTHTGLLREANEDDFVAVPEHGVYLVADGMGGHVAGQLASEICVQTIASYFGKQSEEESLVDADGYTSLSAEALELAEALLLANQRIFERAAANPELTGMGTTAVGIRIIENRVAVSHAGDSRCYLWREGELAQVTVDHSLSNFLLALGREIEARYAEQTMSNVIMRALGLEPEVAVDTKEFLVQAGDRLLLCSDGLSDLVSDEVISAKLGEYGTPLDDIVSYLVDRALDAGGRDNITVLVAEIGGITPPLPKSSFSETLELPASIVTGDADGQE
jgi:protein phosphatase